ncbi:MAG: hypothetical protein Pg6C_00630 [Treponemataceae bacterium]|nr:MAG: hypothetical protein Pg6C_00630 [Treponemataceae bacterium]
MNYYCGNCGAEFRNVLESPYTRCPLCRHTGLVAEIPEHETVAEWEKRRGEKYPYTAPVYAKYENDPTYGWELLEYRNSEWYDYVIVATEAGDPPDDWRPE